MIADRAIYQLQTIQIDDQRYNLFFDSGCGDFVSRYGVVQSLGSRPEQDYSGIIQLGGVVCT